MVGTLKLLDSVAGERHYSRFQEIHISKFASYLESNSQVHGNFKPRSEAIVQAVSELVNGYLCTAHGRKDHSVYTGYSGMALTHFIMYKRTKNLEDLEIAKKLVDTALTRLTGHEVSFLTGDAGPLALGIIIYHHRGDSDRASELRLRLLHLGLNPDPEIPCALINGWAGYLYALLFINKHIPALISEFNIKKVVQKLLRLGVSKKRSTVPLNYEWKGRKYLGALYGVCGILYILLCSDVLDESEIFTLIRPTLDDLIASRRVSVNYPPYPTSGQDLVQWCHGSAGFVPLFIKASETSLVANAMKTGCKEYLGEYTRRWGIMQEGGEYSRTAEPIGHGEGRGTKEEFKDGDDRASQRESAVLRTPQLALQRPSRSLDNPIVLTLVINPSYMANAFECAATVWRYGVLRKGYTLCHGVAGNAYGFLQLYKKTKDLKHLLRAMSFYEWCMHWPRYEAVKPDRPFSLFKGLVYG